MLGDVRHQLGRFADQDRQDTGRVGVEGAGVADAAHAEVGAHASDDVERRHSGRLVHDEYAGAGGGDHQLDDAVVAARTAPSTWRVASSSGAAMVQPAAFL